MELKSR